MAGISPLSGFSWFVVVARSMFRDTIFCCRLGCSFMSKGCFCSSQTDECSTVDTSHFGVKYTFHFDDVVISDLPFHPKRCYGHFDSHSTVSKYQRHWRKKKQHDTKSPSCVGRSLWICGDHQAQVKSLTDELRRLHCSADCTTPLSPAGEDSTSWKTIRVWIQS